MTTPDLTKQETHFAFGRNWAEYAEKITDSEIGEAERGLSRLLAGTSLEGKRFLDIGSGSGLHALAALRLKATEVVAIDIDPDSFATTRAVLNRHAGANRWRAEQISVFDLTTAQFGSFDVVYSWGVLHHTGDMARAIRCAGALVKDGGQFVFALYRRIWMDPFWRVEKRWYTRAAPVAQRRARAVHEVLFRLGLRVTGRRFDDYVRNYIGNRGMDFCHDVHDWMGGWPYESISPAEVEQLMAELGFKPLRVFAPTGRIFGRDPGLFGSGCDEYVYKRSSHANV